MFLEILNVKFYGYDNHYVEVSNYNACENLCLQDYNCKGFQHSHSDDKRFYRCYTKHYKKNVYTVAVIFAKIDVFNRRIIRLWRYRVPPEFLPPQSLMWRSIENRCSRRHIMHYIKRRF